MKDGILAALDAIEQATGEKSVDLVAYCLGGTLSAMALAYLAAAKQAKRVASATLIASLIDFSDLGEWSVFTDEKQLDAFEQYLEAKGYVEAHDLAKLFTKKCIPVTTLQDKRQKPNSRRSLRRPVGGFALKWPR